MRGKALPRGNRGTRGRRRRTTVTIHRLRSRREATRRCNTNDASFAGIGGSACGGTGSRDEAEQSHSACVHREATVRDRTPLLSTRTREHDDAGHAAAEPLLGMLDVQYNLRTQPGRVRCSTGRPGESFEGADANMVPIGDDETPCL